jgi:uncharacterized 2Fe-2S/4Fe-4S cluster protein (DUF4445 family)
LLEAARQLGVDVDSICGGRQTCGKCKVIVESGDFAKYAITSSPNHLTPADATEQDYFARHPKQYSEGARLACTACITGDVLVTVPPESTQRKQIVRKSATERAIEIDPILRQVFVEVEPHQLGARDGDWERLQKALKREWQLDGLRIDLLALRQLTPALKAGKHKVTVTVWNETEVVDVKPGYHEGLYGLAVDVGSTTIAAHLCDLRSGAVLATESTMNPQVTYGEDLMSRVSYVMMHDDGLHKLHTAIIVALNQLAIAAARTAQISTSEIYEAVLVGNTVMHHILLGLDPTELGAAPFTLATHAPVDVKARDLGLSLHPSAHVHFLALEAGHVGSDNLGVIVAEAPDQQDELMLLIDIGTNAEIVLGNRHGLVSCSSPTGPAFEGGQISHGQRAAPGAIERVRIDRKTGEPRFKVIGDERWSDETSEIRATGICGSGIIEVVSELFAAGLLRSDGRFNGDWRLEVGDLGESLISNLQSPISRLRWNGPKAEYVLATAAQSATGKDIVITQDDVRNIQLAKAALYAGCKLLMQTWQRLESGDSRSSDTQSPISPNPWLGSLQSLKIGKIVLAGAFGSYIDPVRAMVLGLYPDCDLGKVVAVGNAAGDGARIALLSKKRREESAQVARSVHYIETAIDPNFQQEFVGAMHLPHMSDGFPHLEALGALPEKQVAPVEDERARRRRERRRVVVEMPGDL